MQQFITVLEEVIYFIPAEDLALLLYHSVVPTFLFSFRIIIILFF